MGQTVSVCKVKRRDHVAKDLRTPKYRMRVVGDKRRKEPKHKGKFYDVS